MKEERKIREMITPQMVMEGAGVRLQRSISPQASNLFDPFLLFDHFAFNEPREGALVGFPMHPHRGIETVTYMLTGLVQHRDSLGNSGVIGSGDVQWMTAGRGILHEEMPRLSDEKNIFGFQLWVNLPASQKMTNPRYQDVKENQIPIVESAGMQVRIISGTYAHVDGPVKEIAADPLYLDVSLQPGTTFTQDIPQGHTALAYVFEGSGLAADQAVKSPQMIIFEDGDSVTFHSESEAMRFVLIAGAPFKEPIVPYGPFVMNTREEIMETLAELKNGTFIR
jgi:redox-sensitive bicupin YhaK (pirin superfamily)